MTVPAPYGLRYPVAYAILALPLAFLGLPLYVYLPTQYAAMPGIGLVLTGLILMAARLLDLLTDPLVGALVDRYRHRISYRALILAASPVLAGGVWLLFVPPEDAGPAYLLGAVSLTYLAWTLMSVPYYAWGAELGLKNDGQVRVAAWREGGVILGMLLALIAPLLAAGDSRMESSAWWLLLCLMLALVVIWWVPAVHRSQGIGGQNYHWTRIWSDTGRPARRLLGLHFINTLANGIPATLFLLYAQQVLGLDMRTAGTLLLIYFLCAVFMLPFWSWWASRQGRTRAWQHAVLVAALGFMPAALLGAGDAEWFLLVCVITGACAGADIAIPAAIQASLAQRESTRLQRPRTAVIFGLWGMVSKLALAIAAGVSLPLLGWFSSPAMGIQQAEVLPLLYAGFAVPIKLMVAALLWRVDIDDSVTEYTAPKEVKHVSPERPFCPSAVNSDGRL